MRWILALTVCALAADAAAHENGITGESGKSGSTCNDCHSGGKTPTVKLAGPSTLQAGASATYTLTISGGAAVTGGLDAALDDASLTAGASLATVSAMTQLLDGEITHTQPVGFTSGSLAFQLTVKAPATARTMTLYAAGNSTNGNGSDSGDKAAATTMSITVAGSTPPPATPPDFAGAPPGADLATATDPGPAASDLGIPPTPSGRDLATPAGDPGSVGTPAGGSSHATASSSGCSMLPVAGAADDGGALDFALAFALGLFGWAGARLSGRARRPLLGSTPPPSSGFASARARR
jgi:hypothetical protein